MVFGLRPPTLRTRSILDVWIEQRERERERDDLVEQTRLLRQVGRRGDSSLLAAQRDAFSNALDYERARLERPSTRPRDYLDAIRRVPEAEPVSRALSGGQIGQPPRFTEEDRGGGILGDVFGAIRGGFQGLTNYLGEAFDPSLQPPSQFESLLGQRARGARDEFMAGPQPPSILQQANRDPFAELTDPLGENLQLLGAAAEPFTRSIVPEPILEDIEGIPVIGEFARTEAEFATSPFGAAAFAFGGPAVEARAIVGGIALPTAGKAVGLPEEVNIGLQLFGNVAGVALPSLARFGGEEAIVGAIVKDLKRNRLWKRPVAGGAGDEPYAAAMRGFDDTAAEVVTTGPESSRLDIIIKNIAARIGVNSSVLKDTEIGRATVAWYRQKIAIEELTDVALQAGLDVHAQPFTGARTLFRRGQNALFSVRRDGTIGNVTAKNGMDSLHWNDVFSRPERYNFTEGQRRFHEDFTRIIREIELNRLEAGLDPLPLISDTGELYIPRIVRGKNGFVVLKPTRKDLRRSFELAEDGVAEGIVYESDPREVLRLHLRRTYNDILETQFSDHIERLNAEAMARGERLFITPRDLVPEATLRRVSDATLGRLAAEKAVKDERRFVIRSHQLAQRMVTRAQNRANNAARRVVAVQGEVRGRARAVEGRIGGTETLEQRLKATEERVTDANKVLDDLANANVSDTRANVVARRELQLARQENVRIVGELGGRAQLATGRRQTPLSFGSRLQNAQKRVDNAAEAVRQIKPDTAARKAAERAAARERVTLNELQAQLRERIRGGARLGRSPVSLGQRKRNLEILAENAKAEVEQLRVVSKQFPKIRVVDLDKAVTPRASRNLSRAQTELKSAQAEYTAELDKARASSFDTAKLFNAQEEIPIQRWNNRFFPKEDAEFLREGIDSMLRPQQRNWLIRGIETLGNTIRFLASVADFAEPFLQGLFTLAYRPRVWAKATIRHYQGFVDPTAQARFVKAHLPAFQEMARHGTPIGDAEFFAALQRGGGFSPGAYLELLPKGDEARQFLRQGGRQTFGRFQASYNSGLGANRALLTEGLQDVIKDAGERQAFIRNMTGGLDSRSLAIGPNQRALEGMWLGFSPRFMRSTFALAFDMRKGPLDPRGRESLIAMTKLVAGATGIYISTGLALGKSWDEIETGLNPLNGKKFISHQINGDWIGIGGQVRAITQLLTESVAAVAKGEAGDFAKLNIENPIVKFWMFRGAPGINIAGGALEVAGADVLPFDEVDTIPDLFKHFLTSAVPFSIQGYFEGEQPITVGASVVGGRTSPERDFEREAAAVQQDFAAGLFSDSYKLRDPQRISDLTNQDEEDFLERHPAIAEARVKSLEEGVEEGSVWAQMRSDGDTDRARLSADLDSVTERFRNGSFLEGRTVSEANKAAWDAVDNARTMFAGTARSRTDRFAEQIEQIQGGPIDLTQPLGAMVRDLSSREYRNEEDRILAIFHAVNNRWPTRDNDIQWDGYERELAQALSPEELRIARAAGDVGDHRLERARSLLLGQIPDAYWDIPEGTSQRSQRLTFRAQNVAVDAALWLLGKVSRVQTSEAQEHIRAWSQEIWGTELEAEQTSPQRRRRLGPPAPSFGPNSPSFGP